MEVKQNHPDLEAIGFHNLNQVYWQLHTPQLYEQAVRRQEGFIAHLGPLVVRTGHHTGRAPKDRYIVREAGTEANIWWGDINKPFEPEKFDALYNKVMAYFQGKNAFVQNVYAGADPRYRLSVRVITEKAWHSLFVRNMFIRVPVEELEGFKPDFTVIHAPSFHAIREVDGTNSSSFILINFARKVVLIGGTNYAGEIKKSIFSIMNYTLPIERGVLTMHASANEGSGNDVAVFFGLSGTGKTTLSTDAERTLIGDDEHGWSDEGIFNLEGGCYAKVIRLSPTGEPEIFSTTRQFGTVLENVGMDMANRRVDLDDETLTENTRASYPITHIANANRSGMGGHAKHIIFLTADAFGVMPPVSKLTTEQAMYHFLSGYTAKVAGTEAGVQEPSATFSACFGEPFMPLSPVAYAEHLAERIEKHGASVWLVNTGWTGGPYGVGSRMKLNYTRAMIHAILNGELDTVETWTEPHFGLAIPKTCSGVPDDVLNPRSTWADPAEFDAKAQQLAGLFHSNFEKKFGAKVDARISGAGPKGGR